MYFEDFLKMLEAMCNKESKLQFLLKKIKEVFESIFMDIIERDLQKTESDYKQLLRQRGSVISLISK